MFKKLLCLSLLSCSALMLITRIYAASDPQNEPSVPSTSEQTGATCNATTGTCQGNWMLFKQGISPSSTAVKNTPSSKDNQNQQAPENKTIQDALE